MPTAIQIHTFDFHGDQIETAELDGTRYVPMKRIAENMKLNWDAQRVKLREQQAKFSCLDITATGADGKTYEMLCVPVENLPLWLASINPLKIPDEMVRTRVELYQAECAIALHDYWMKGYASRGSEQIRNPRTAALIHALEQLDEVEREQARQADVQARLADAQAKTVARQIVQEDRIHRIEAKQSAFEEGASYFTVLGYCALKSVPIDLATAGTIGRKASALSREKNIPIDHVKDPRFGKVNSYHESILDAVVSGMLGDVAA